MSLSTTKVKIRKPFENHDRYLSEKGSPIKDIYDYDLNAKGQKILVKIGEKNLYKEIQSYAEETEIGNILARCAIGDYTDFRPQGIFADITKMPNNLIDAKREMMKVERLWNNLKPEIKAKYDFDLNLFMGKVGEKAWLIDTGLLTADEGLPTIKENVKVEVPKVETPGEKQTQ